MNSFLENRPTVGRKDAVIGESPKSEVSFQPLFSASAITASLPASSSSPETKAEAAPQVELIQNDGRVERIIVTCSCCNRIELQCQY
jgi:hypothetical protein